MDIGFFNSGQERMARATLEMMDAMKALDAETRRSYEQAMDLVPHLVQEETPVKHFLQTEDYNPTAAAKRLALYWKYRHEIFDTRWLLPMNQTGAGCLTANDVAVLRTGYLVYFPSTATQPYPILMANFGHPHHKPGYGARLLYYYATTAMRWHDNVRTAPGLSTLYLVTSAPRPAPNLDKTAWTSAKSALPIRVARIFIVQSYESGKEHLIDSLAFQTTRQIQFNSDRTVHVLGGTSQGETLQLLQQAGVSLQCVPASMGGTYQDHSFADWVRMRISVEDIMSAANPLSQPRARAMPMQIMMKEQEANHGHLTLFQGASPWSTDDEHSAHSSSSSGHHHHPNDNNNNNDQAILVRQRKAASARRAYHKQKLALLQLENQVQAWQDRNAVLRADNARLTTLLEQAQQCIGIMTTTMMNNMSI